MPRNPKFIFIIDWLRKSAETVKKIAGGVTSLIWSHRAMRKVVAFCPWVESRMAPFDMCGVRMMGFRDAEQAIPAATREALWRAMLPYCDHFLNEDRIPQPWNDNPLLYAVEAANPLKEPTEDEARLIILTNTYLYVCVFATNRLHKGGGHDYTNGADWALYFHPVQNPVWFSVGERRLYGQLLGGGYRWTGSAFTQPLECNRFRLIDARLDQSLISGITALNAGGRAGLYLHPLRTFRLGTSDNHLWQREDDLPFIWGAIEQIAESEGFGSCAAAQQEVQRWADALTLPPSHSTCLVRAVIDAAPEAEYVWNGDFRPGRGGRENLVNAARLRGIEFSALERAMDELNFARNRMIHDGFIPQLEWNLVTLAYLGSRFWIALFKRILAWEGVRAWTEDDECDLVGLQALAREGRTYFADGYTAYEQAVRDCHWDNIGRRVTEHLERMERETRAE